MERFEPRCRYVEGRVIVWVVVLKKTVYDPNPNANPNPNPSLNIVYDIVKKAAVSPQYIHG